MPWRDCDFLIAIGARFDDRQAAASRMPSRAQRTAMLHISISTRRDQQGEAIALEPRWRCETSPGFIDRPRPGAAGASTLGCGIVAELKRSSSHELRPGKYRIQPHFVVEVLGEITGGRAIITTGVGPHQMRAAQYFPFGEARSFSHLGQHGRRWALDCQRRLARSSASARRIIGSSHMRRRRHPDEPGDLETATTCLAMP